MNSQTQPKSRSIGENDLEDFAADVEAVLDRKGALSDIFDTLQRAHIAGESVQSELNDIFEGFPELVRVVGTGETDKLENFLEQALEAGILGEETRDEFEEFWSEISWISPGVRAYLFEERGTPATWTDDEIDIYSAGYGPAVEYVYLNGVDEDYRLRAPLPVFYNETIERLQYLVGWIAASAQEGDLGSSTFKVVDESRDVLRDTVNLLDQLSSRPASPDGASGEEEVEEPADYSARMDEAEEIRGFQ